MNTGDHGRTAQCGLNAGTLGMTDQRCKVAKGKGRLETSFGADVTSVLTGYRERVRPLASIAGPQSLAHGRGPGRLRPVTDSFRFELDGGVEGRVRPL